MRPIRLALLTATLLAAAACGDTGDTDGAAGSAGTAAVTPASAAQPGKDWTTVVQMTPEGGFRMGNPDAPVKFVEFASLTCPACAAFHSTAYEALKANYVAGGRVSYELRNFVLNGPDLAATVVARCQAPSAFFPLVGQMFAGQAGWLEPFTRIAPDVQTKISAAPSARQPLLIADAGKLDEYFRLRGVPRSRYEACLTDPRHVTALEAIRKDAIETYDLEGTPTFVLNGRRVDARSWAELEPLIKARLG